MTNEKRSKQEELVNAHQTMLLLGRQRKQLTQIAKQTGSTCRHKPFCKIMKNLREQEKVAIVKFKLLGGEEALQEYFANWW